MPTRARPRIADPGRRVFPRPVRAGLRVRGQGRRTARDPRIDSRIGSYGREATGRALLPADARRRRCGTDTPCASRRSGRGCGQGPWLGVSRRARAGRLPDLALRVAVHDAQGRRTPATAAAGDVRPIGVDREGRHPRSTSNGWVPGRSSSTFRHSCRGRTASIGRATDSSAPCS